MGDKGVDEYHLRHCMLYEFRQGNNASQTKKNICTAYPGAVTTRECQRLLNKFKKGEWDFFETQNSGGKRTSLSLTSNDRLKESNIEVTQHERNKKEFAKKQELSRSTSEEHPEVVVKKAKEEEISEPEDEISPKNSSATLDGVQEISDQD